MSTCVYTLPSLHFDTPINIQHKENLSCHQTLFMQKVGPGENTVYDSIVVQNLTLTATHTHSHADCMR